MRKLILSFLLAMLLASPVLADDYYISDQGGTHVGSCVDNTIYSPSTFNAYNLNYGGSAVISVGSSAIGGAGRIIARFDLTTIPGDSEIIAAEIVLVATSIAGGGDTISLYRIATANNGWVEGVQDGVLADDATDESCWNWKAYNEGAWAGSAGLSTAGTDHYNTKLATDQAISTTGTKAFALNDTGLAAMKAMLAGNSIEFIFKNLTTTTGNYITFASSENGTVGNRPYLHITTAGAPALIIRR